MIYIYNIVTSFKQFTRVTFCLKLSIVHRYGIGLAGQTVLGWLDNTKLCNKINK